VKIQSYQLAGILALLSLGTSSASVLYVGLHSGTPTPPYTNWSTAAISINDAVDAANPGDLILVTNGVYESGGRVVYGTVPNCVAVTKAVTVQSVNGPAVTVIQGSGRSAGTGAVRCAYLTNGATLSGFTLTNGEAMNYMGNDTADHSGGGVWCEPIGALVTNCLIISNNAGYGNGGGAYRGTLINCTIANNSADYYGGGTYLAALNNCVLSNNSVFADSGGGACYGTLTNCVAVGNFAFTSGGGAYGSTLNNCTLTNNAANFGGGGAASSTLDDCTLSGNNAEYGAGGGMSNIMNHCTLTNNLSQKYGGGASASTLNDCMLVGNTSYITGGGAVASTLNNCTLNGNSAKYYGGGCDSCVLSNSFLVGNLASYGAGANGSMLNNCTLAGNSASAFGGGTYGSTNINCAITNNSSGEGGGGAEAGVLTNCLIVSNSAVSWGGGADTATLENCTLVGNSCQYGGSGGANSCVLDNCILYYNIGQYNYNGSSLNYCCVTPLPPDGTGNFTNAPLFADLAGGDFHLQTNSPCVNTGDNDFVGTSTDLDGNPRVVGGTVDIGAYEVQVTIPLVAFIQPEATNVVAGFPMYLTGLTTGGRAAASLWDFGDGTTTNDELTVWHAWAAPGDYPVVFTAYNVVNPGGVSAMVTVHVVAQDIRYVRVDNTNPMTPYASWDTAATNIQDAVDAAFVGGAIWVSNGVYQTGGRPANGHALSNRVVIDKPVVVQSVNGPSVTVIQGSQLPFISTNFDGNMRCVYLTTNATLMGFTLSNGGTLNTGDANADQSGGGVWCESINAQISNCILTGNAAHAEAGGVFQGTLTDCVLTGNSAGGYGGSGWSSGGGAQSAILKNCLLTENSGGEYGGGADGSTLNECTLAGNSCLYGGGGGSDCTMKNCVLTNNAASDGHGGGTGGGADSSSRLYNCRLVANVTDGYGGGTESCTLVDCIFGGNSAQTGGAADSSDLYNCVLTNNYAALTGGGVSWGYNVNCTIVNNSAGQNGGGSDASELDDCIVYFNTAPTNANIFFEYSTVNDSCTTPAPAQGVDNVTNNPLFLDFANGNLHLQSSSPCINGGRNNYLSNSYDLVNLTNDLDGKPRIAGGTVDIGAYEYQTPTSVISYAWLQQYGLPTDGSVDFGNLDGASFNVYQDWIAGLNPLDSTSVLVMQTPQVSTNSAGLAVSWLSVSNRTYYLQQATNLAVQPAFSTIQSNIAGQAGATSVTDTTATNGGPYFYRVGVQQ
jgi:hypothetical protein